MCEIQQSLANFFISRLGHANIVLMFCEQEFLVPDVPTDCGHSSSVSPTVSTLRAGSEKEEEEAPTDRLQNSTIKKSNFEHYPPHSLHISTLHTVYTSYYPHSL